MLFFRKQSGIDRRKRYRVGNYIFFGGFFFGNPLNFPNYLKGEVYNGFIEEHNVFFCTWVWEHALEKVGGEELAGGGVTEGMDSILIII